MKFVSALLLIAVLGGTWQIVRPTCVLESDFGFILNCAFKKSGLFRVRNLGGVKAHIGLGFSVGDELGFKESLTNVEQSNKRRSATATRLQAQLIQAQQNAKRLNKQSASGRNPYTDSKEGSVEVVTPLSMGQMSSLQKAIKKSPAGVPPFKPIPPAQERYTISKSPTPSLSGNPEEIMAVIAVPKKDVLSQQAQDKQSNDFSVRVLPGINNEIVSQGNSILALPSTNYTDDDLEMALMQVQKQPIQMPIKKKPTTTTTPKPSNKYANSVGKVMNAPKEYYPVGYDKNFDDNFASRVELPETSFYCGDQKHFPGLYADEDLGCMVFHVCALTDDGLIMKSFLCPESTLFDQTILKCNWWFYVDCKNSKKLYDSNIPISKSYQLMKALTFFSAFKNDHKNSTKINDKD